VKLAAMLFTVIAVAGGSLLGRHVLRAPHHVVLGALSPTPQPHATDRVGTPRRAPTTTPIHSRARPSSPSDAKRAGRKKRRVSPAARNRPIAKAEYLVLFVLDGAQPNYFHVPGIPHVRALIRRGTLFTNAWAGLLESETPTGHASLGTGSSPRQDGIAAFNWATSDNIPLSIFNPTAVQDGQVEHILSSAGAPSIAGLVHRYDRHAQVVALSGHKYYAADAIGGPSANVIMYYTGTPDGKFVPVSVPGHSPPAGVLRQRDLLSHSHGLRPGQEDHLAMKLDLATFRKLHQRVTLMNVPEFDWPLGHVRGGGRDPRAVRTLMQGFDRDLASLERVYRQKGVLDRTLFVITADHGMTPIYHTVDDSIIKNAAAAAGTSIITDTYHTAGYVWLKDESKAARVAANISAVQNPLIQAAYFKETTPGGYDYVRATGPDLFLTSGVEHANQYLLNSFASATAPDVVVLYREDTASLPGGQASWKGDHGGSNWQSQHIPLLFAGPGVRRNHETSFPARLMDIAPTALTLMGISPSPMSGVPVTDVMQRPPGRLLARQRALGRAVRPVVGALQRESAQELARGE
jgi:hypothetical protein